MVHNKKLVWYKTSTLRFFAGTTAAQRRSVLAPITVSVIAAKTGLPANITRCGMVFSNIFDIAFVMGSCFRMRILTNLAICSVIYSTQFERTTLPHHLDKEFIITLRELDCCGFQHPKILNSLTAFNYEGAQQSFESSISCKIVGAV